MLREPMDRKLRQIYYSVKHPGGLGGVENLYAAAKREGLKVSRQEIQEFLQGQPTYTKHKPLRKKFRRNKVYAHGIDFVWQIDLVDLSRLSRLNRGYTFLLSVIDVFSKRGWMIPLKSKSGQSLVKAFQSILKDGRVPYKVHSDKGTEFTNKLFQKLLADNDIAFYTTHNETKASVVERFNRTIKTRMFRYFTAQNTRRYIDILDDLIEAYNTKVHRSIGMPPNQVSEGNELRVWEALYGSKDPPIQLKKQERFRVGDRVRISMLTQQFKKGYLPGWTDEVFEITKCLQREPVVYQVADLMGEVLKGTFYTEELQKVRMNDDEFFPIEKILKTRKRRGIKEYYVKYLNWPEKFSGWVTDVKSLSAGK